MKGNLNWFWQSVIAMIFLVPAWRSIGFFNSNFQVRPEVFLTWFALGIAIASGLFGAPSLGSLLPSWRVACTILLLGLILGGVANIQIFRAVDSAPNPGLPVAIANVASVGVFIVAALLAKWMPDYFDHVKTDPWAFLGIFLTIIGATLISIRR